MAHTPGPWSWTQWPGISGHTHFGIDADKWRLAIVHSGNADDANLMAAAPELLRAMRLIADDLGALDLDSNGWRTWDATAVDSLIAGALRLATLAIAKAEGRE